MPSQIFKNKYPIQTLFDFLELYSDKKHNYYYFTKTNFKKAVYEDAVMPYCQSLKKFYYLSKHKYLDKKQTYRSFITSKIKYDKSNYEIVYYIYFAP